VTSTLRQLRWLPVQFRIKYKLCLLMHQIHTSRAPSYLTDIVTRTATISSRLQLRSGNGDRYEQPRTRLNFGQRAFSYAAPAAGNSLPPTLQQMSNTDSFKRHLKHFCTSKLTLTSFLYLVQLISWSLARFYFGFYFSFSFFVNPWSFLCKWFY